MKRPLFTFAACFYASSFILCPLPKLGMFLLFIISGVFCAALLILKSKFLNTYIFAALFALFFASGLLFLSMHRDIEPVLAFDDKPAEVEGYVIDLGQSTAYGYKYSFRAKSVTADNLTYKRPFGIMLYSAAPIEAKPYEAIKLTAVLRLPPRADRSGGFDSRVFLRTKGIYLEANVASPILIENTGEPGGNLLLRSALSLQKYMSDTLSAGMTKENAVIAAAIVTNYKGDLSAKQRSAFSKSGLSHVMAASGMHVSILAAGILLIFSAFKLKRRLSLFITILAAAGFSAVAGFSPSIVRSVVMFGVMAAGYAISESYDGYTSLGTACILILAQNPFAVYDVGFMLSAAATLGIISLYPGMYRAVSKKEMKRPAAIYNYFAGLLCLTVSAMAFTVPICMTVFGGIPLLSPISNILAVPIVPLVFLLSALCGILAPLSLAKPVFWLLDLLCGYINGVSRVTASFPYGYIPVDTSLHYIWALFAVFVVIYTAANRKSVKKTHALSLIVASLLCVSVCAAPYNFGGMQKGDMRMAVLDVGQGQCVMMSTVSHNIMIDCGTNSYDCDAAQNAYKYLSQNGIYKLDAVIVSHYHDDHANGIISLMEKTQVDMLILPAAPDSGGVMDALTLAAGELSIPVVEVAQNSVFSMGEAHVRIIARHMDFSVTSSANENNLVVFVDYLDSEFLIMGDAPGSDENFLAEVEDIDTDVLLVSHHGSNNSSAQYFLDTVTPNIGVISVGADNSYGHPANSALERLNAAGVTVFRTDRDGIVVIDTRGDGEYTVTHSKGRFS